MIKQSIAILITLSVCGIACAKSSFIACPGNLKVANSGQTIKTNSGSWEVTITAGNNIHVPKSVPGLMRTDNPKILKLVCFDDSKSPFPKYIENRKPIYNVYFTYKGSCQKPVVNKTKNGFECQLLTYDTKKNNLQKSRCWHCSDEWTKDLTL